MGSQPLCSAASRFGCQRTRRRAWAGRLSRARIRALRRWPRWVASSGVRVDGCVVEGGVGWAEMAFPDWFSVPDGFRIEALERVEELESAACGQTPIGMALTWILGPVAEMTKATGATAASRISPCAAMTIRRRTADSAGRSDEHDGGEDVAAQGEERAADAHACKGEQRQDNWPAAGRGCGGWRGASPSLRSSFTNSVDVRRVHCGGGFGGVDKTFCDCPPSPRVYRGENEDKFRSWRFRYFS